jgi:hypothetical protein
MERIAEGVVSVYLDTSELEEEMLRLVTEASAEPVEAVKL